MRSTAQKEKSNLDETLQARGTAKNIRYIVYFNCGNWCSKGETSSKKFDLLTGKF